MKVTIEPSEDPESIADLLRQVHEEHRQRHPEWFKPFERAAALDAVRNMLLRHGARLFVARVEGVCLGYAPVQNRVRQENAFRYASRSLIVDQMAVADTHRRKGIGTLMMERIRGEAVRRGAQRVELKVYSDNDGARRFYEAQGFVRFQDVMESSL